MNRAMMLAAVVATAWMGLPASPVQACLCREATESVAEAAHNSDAVFEGQVVALELLEVPGQREGTFIWKVSVTLRVARSWKGIEKGLVKLRTGSGVGDCGYDFRLQRAYLVFAKHDEGGRLYTSSCSRTAQVDQSTNTLRQLGPPPKTFEELRLGSN